MRNVALFLGEQYKSYTASIWNA